ncbi:MAG: dienelactone hydrolase [Verrucomicrobiales bacterium]|nr:dienelactone hydrolase [Verrucomicrobiales bacterium]
MKFPGTAAYTAVLWLFCCNVVADNATNSPIASVISFAGEKLALNAYLFRPETPGSHPVIIWNHGSPKPILQSGPVSRFDALADYFLQRGFVLFIPDRRARNVVFSDGEAVDTDQEATASARRALKESLDENHSDFQSAVRWLKKQAFVDPTKIFLGGYSSGAVQALYEAGVTSDVRGFILFTPGSAQWSNSPFLREMMTTGVKMSKAPIFIVQVQNDAHLQAISTLGKELAKKGKPNATMVYPPHGKTQKEASIFALTGVHVWGPDIAGFLDAAMRD